MKVSGCGAVGGGARYDPAVKLDPGDVLWKHEPRVGRRARWIAWRRFVPTRALEEYGRMEVKGARDGMGLDKEDYRGGEKYLDMYEITDYSATDKVHIWLN